MPIMNPEFRLYVCQWFFFFHSYYWYCSVRILLASLRSFCLLLYYMYSRAWSVCSLFVSIILLCLRLFFWRYSVYWCFRVCYYLIKLHLAFFPHDGYSETDRTGAAQDYHLILSTPPPIPRCKFDIPAWLWLLACLYTLALLTAEHRSSVVVFISCKLVMSAPTRVIVCCRLAIFSSL